MSHDPVRTGVLSPTGTANFGHSQGRVQLVVLPSQQSYARTCFCGKATTFYLLKASFCFCQEKKVKKNNVRNYFLPNLKRAAVLLRHQLQAHAPSRNNTSIPASRSGAHGSETLNLGSTSAETNGYADGKHGYGKHNMGGEGGRDKKIQDIKPSAPSHLFQTLLTNKGSISKCWCTSMDVLLGSQDTSQTWLIRSQPSPGNTPREPHRQQPAPGRWKMQKQQLPHLSFWSCSQFNKEVPGNENASHNLWSLFISGDDYRQWTDEITGQRTMTFMLLAWQ